MKGILVIFISACFHTSALRIDPASRSVHALHAQNLYEQLQHYQTPPVFSETSESRDSGAYTKSLKVLLTKVIGGPAGGFRQYIEDARITFMNKQNNTTSGEWPRIIHQTAKSETDLNPIFKASRRSWQHNHPGWEYKFWNDTGMNDFMERHYPSFMETWNLYPRQIMRIDAARYFWMHHYGGVYADMDYFALRPWDSLFTEETVSQVIIPRLSPGGMVPNIPWKKKNAVCNALFLSKPQHPFWEIVHEYLPYTLHQLGFRLDARKSANIYQETEALIDEYFGKVEPEEVAGPVFLTDLVEKLGEDRMNDLKVKIPSGSLFYPIDWTKGDDTSWRDQHSLEFSQPDLLEDALHKSFPNSLGATVWTHSWNGI